MSKLLATLVIAFASFNASATTLATLSGCDVKQGPYGQYAAVEYFDQAICSFSATSSSSLTVSNFGSGLIDPSAHGPYGVAIDLRTNGTWTNVFTSPIYTADTNLSSIFTMPIDFVAMSVDGLRLRGSRDEGWSFHESNGAMTFTLADAPAAAAVPEPESLAIFGLGLVGLIARRKASKK